jgi:hypothetical protein
LLRTEYTRSPVSQPSQSRRGSEREKKEKEEKGKEGKVEKGKERVKGIQTSPRSWNILKTSQM